MRRKSLRKHRPEASRGDAPVIEERAIGKGSPPISRVLSRPLAGAGQSFLLAAHYCTAPAAYPGALRAASTPPYLALPRMGFTLPSVSPRPR